MVTRSKRRGVDTVPLYSDVTTATKQVLDAIAAATGARKNVVIEQIVAHIALDERGVPVWWDQPLPSDQELDLRAS